MARVHVTRWLYACSGLVLALCVSAPRAAHAQSCTIPGFTEAAFGDQGVTLTGNACTDSFDSSVPPNTYAGTKCSPPGVPCVGGVGTNATNSGAITLSGANACVKGACQIGAGGDISNISGASKCTSTAVKAEPVTLPSVSVPVLPNATPFNVSSPATLVPGRTYGTVTGSGNSSNVLTLNTGAYVMTSLSLSGQSSLRIASGPVVVYLKGPGAALDLSGNGLNNATGLAPNLIFMCADTVTSVKVVGNGTTAFGLYCPRASVQVSGNGDVYGAIVGKTVSMVGNGAVHYDKALASVTSNQIACSSVETSRAAPIVATLTPEYGGAAQDTVVQGSFETPTGVPATISTTADIAAWTFPHIKGHMRARLVSSLTTTASSFAAAVCTGTNTPSGCSVLFDAGATGNIPAMSFSGCATPSGSCRHVFTNVNAAAASGRTTLPATAVFGASDASTIGPLIAPTSAVPGITSTQQQTIMQKILQGKLGGVDRSTVAVIGPSTIAGSGTRPTMAYFGATDGMLHAVCASDIATGPCAGRVGTELWAFVPRVQLPLLRTNTSRIDGSPHVVDSFGDFDGDGSAEWATILTFQTGYGTGATPAVYALDITDPTAPRVLWERTAPTSPGESELGTGLSLASARVLTGGSSQHLVVAVTSNGGTGGPGIVATSLSLATGADVWEHAWLYPTAPRGVAADGPLPASAIPGGAVGVDVLGSGQVSDFVFGDIYGNLWRVDATSGVSRNGVGKPLFSFTSNKRPIGATPAIYEAGGQPYAVIASGGYVDHGGITTWRASTQYVLAVRLTSTSATPIDEDDAACGTCELAFKLTTTGQYGFAQALVVGTQLFVTTDSQDVNASGYGATANTGTITAVDLGTGTTTTSVVHAGASSLAHAGTTLVSSSGQRQQRTTAAAGTVGASVDISTVASMSRLLWLRVE